MDVASNRKMLFDSFAKKMNFDPLVSSNWIKVSKKMIANEKVCLNY